MSHQPERTEKNCLNCGTTVAGRYCQKCGQENTVTHQGFWALTKHFVYDVLHFDGKFFHTLLYLFTRPGFVAKEYVQGRRVSYLDPVRMYLFTSALFFLIFFTLKPYSFRAGNLPVVLSAEDRQELIEEYKNHLAANPHDTLLVSRIALLRDTAVAINIDSLGWGDWPLTVGKKSYVSLQAYEADQDSLSAAEKDGWLERRFVRQALQAGEKYGRSDKVLNVWVDIFLHKLPYLLFVSLPFFALLLKLLYVRRKNFFYSDHAVFTLYHYIFSFILLLVIQGVGGLRNWTGWSIFLWLIVAFVLVWPVYLFREMRRFYGQSRGKTFGKFLLLNLLAFLVLLLLLLVFFVFSVFQL